MEYTRKVKTMQVAGNPHPHIMGYWITTLIYDSPEMDCQIGERKIYKPLKNPKRLNSWADVKYTAEEIK